VFQKTISVKVKIDTKEKFHVITVEEPIFSANMTEEFNQLLMPYLQNDLKNIVVKMGTVKEMEETAAQNLLNIQQIFYDNNCSFVICELTPQLENWLDEKDLLEIMNVTPTESEAWDIVQMEEIERELMD
jgi:anti-anti-sigma factor